MDKLLAFYINIKMTLLIEMKVFNFYSNKANKTYKYLFIYYKLVLTIKSLLVLWIFKGFK